MTPRNDLIHELANLAQDDFDDLVLEAESERLRQQEAQEELLEQEEEMDPYANIPTETLTDLLQRAQAVAEGHYFETEFTLTVKVSGHAIAQSGDGFADPDCLEIEVRSPEDLPSCVIDTVSEALSELILDDPDCLEEISEAVAGVTDTCTELVEEVAELEQDHDLAEEDLLTQLVEKSGASLA